MPDPMLTEEILHGLRGRPKRLPSALLYDALGSTLFEAVTLVPEYGVTRADLRLVERHAEDVIRMLPGTLDVVELGPGGGRKALMFLEPLCARQASTAFTAVDVSSAALESCRRTLSSLEGVTVHCVEAMYLDGLRAAPRTPHARRLVLFLGSNLSNFDRHDARAFLRDVRGALRADDALLLATDLGDDPARLVPAYDDPLGVTAVFNRNVLVRLNREWGADFDLAAFVHEARWDPAERRIEMHLVATRACAATMHGETFTLEPGESIWTESSHRFEAAELRAWAIESGFECAAQWIDGAWPFGHSLLVAR